MPCSAKLPPSCFQDGSRSQLGPNLAQLGSILASSWLPRGPQEAPKRPPRGPKKPHLHDKNEHFVWEGCYFPSYPVACNMSPLGRRRGPALRASIRRRPEGGTTGGSSQCRITLGLTTQIWPLRSIRGLRHSVDPLTCK